MNNIDELTQRENEVLAQIIKGKRNREIAQELVISEDTVENHIYRIFRKLNVTTRTEAAFFALKNDLVKIAEIPQDRNISGDYNVFTG
jgi:DNA-binding NarL/FixJ family response regulator